MPGYSLSGTILWGGLLLMLSAAYSGSETGLYRMNRLRLHLACREKKRSAMILDRLLDDQQFLISVFLVGNNIVNYLLTSVITGYFQHRHFSSREIELYNILFFTPFLFVFGETVPKMCFYSRANALMLRAARFIKVSYWVVRFTGFGFVVNQLSKLSMALANRFNPGGSMTSRDWDDLGVLLRENLVAGPLSKIQGGLAERLLQLPHIRLARILTPMKNVFALPEDVSREVFINELHHHPFARVPLYRDRVQNIVGVVSIYEVLGSSSDCPPRTLCRPVPRISADENVLTALNCMRNYTIRLALVVDRNDKVLGIITINDLLDEIMAGLEK
jgi:CBS domain containing-hemolysin-like protein